MKKLKEFGISLLALLALTGIATAQKPTFEDSTEFPRGRNRDAHRWYSAAP